MGFLQDLLGGVEHNIDQQGQIVSKNVPSRIDKVLDNIRDVFSGMRDRESRELISPQYFPTPTPVQAEEPTQTPSPTPTQTPPTPTPTNAPGQEYVAGYSNGQVPVDFVSLIQQASEETGIHPAVLAAVLMQESGFDPNAQAGGDYGSAQINLASHPDVTEEQAYDPSFAVPWMARYLAESLGLFDNDMSKAIASYNVGRGGVSQNLGQDTPYGGGAKGQEYIDNVARNLEEDLRKQLNFRTTY